MLSSCDCLLTCTQLDWNEFVHVQYVSSCVLWPLQKEEEKAPQKDDDKASPASKPVFDKDPEQVEWHIAKPNEVNDYSILTVSAASMCPICDLWPHHHPQTHANELHIQYILLTLSLSLCSCILLSLLASWLWFSPSTSEPSTLLSWWTPRGWRNRRRRRRPPTCYDWTDLRPQYVCFILPMMLPS